MSKILKHYSNNKSAIDILNDPEKFKNVLFMIQESADAYMNEAQELLQDNKKSSQEKAETALKIAQAIIDAEKSLRDLEMYNFIGIKSRGMSYITDI